MLSRLPESGERRNRSLFGMTASIGAHLVVIAAAVHATAQSRPRTPEPTGITVLPFVQERPRTENHRQPPLAPVTNPHLPSLINPIGIDPRIPSIDFIPPSPTSPTDFENRGILRTSDPTPITSGPGVTFRADQVERQVALLGGAPLPRYPESLRNAGVEGNVLAQFTVDEHGLVDPDSVRFVRSDNVLFEESVRSVLQRMRFSPAEIGGRKVRQLVQMPFVFTITRR